MFAWSMPPSSPCRPLVEQAARLAMPAVTPAERHNPERYGSPNAIRPARLRAPPQAAPSLPISVFSVFSVVCFFLRVLRVLRGLLFSVFSVFSVVCFSPCPLWFVFPVPSVSCPMWGRLSSLRPAFQPALAPFTHRPLRHPMPCFVGADQPVRPFSSDLGALPCSRKGAVPRGASRQACHAGLSVEHAVLRATPAVMPVVGFPLPLCHRPLFVGQALRVGQAF